MPEAAKEWVKSQRLQPVAVAVLLIAYPIILPEPTTELDPLFVVVNLVFASLLVLWAVKRSGLGLSELGLGRSTLGRSLLLGGLIGACSPLIAYGLYKWPFFQGLPWWGQISIPFESLYYRLGFRIPVGTAAFEEVTFRGVLFALLVREWGKSAIWLSTSIFGIYHIGLIARIVGRAGVDTWPMVGMIAGGVAVTLIWGLIFAFIRYRSGNVAGSALAHWMAYSSANVLVVAMTRLAL